MLYKVCKYDIMSQYKQGFYLVYGILSFFYLLILFNIPSVVRMEVTAYFILTDTSVMGLIFVGALVLLEKQQNILQSLFVTPLTLSTYLWAKVISLTVIAILTSSAIGFIPGGMLNNPATTLVSVILSSMFFTFLGLGISARVHSLNGYIAGIMIGGVVLSSPVALYFSFPEWSVIFPSNAAFDLLIVKPEVQTIRGIIADVAVLICWNILGFLYAKKQFMKHVIQK